MPSRGSGEVCGLALLSAYLAKGLLHCVRPGVGVSGHLNDRRVDGVDCSAYTHSPTSHVGQPGHGGCPITKCVRSLEPGATRPHSRSFLNRRRRFESCRGRHESRVRICSSVCTTRSVRNSSRKHH